VKSEEFAAAAIKMQRKNGFFFAFCYFCTTFAANLEINALITG
jgi:hypothetical protein